jgi:predicted membrane protein
MAMNKSTIKVLVTGILLALLVIRMFVMFSVPLSYQLFTLFLASTAFVYFGSGLSDSRHTWISVELIMSCVFFQFAFLGFLYSPIWLVIGFILHGIWDMLHHPKVVKTKVVKWFPPLCAIFDFVVAVFILTFY